MRREVGNKSGPAKTKSTVEKVWRIFVLLCFWMILVLGQGVFSEDGLRAKEGGNVLHLPEPIQKDIEVHKARVVSDFPKGSLEIVRTPVGETGPVMVITGFPCEQIPEACEKIKEGKFRDAASLYRDRIAQGVDGAAIRCGLANSLFLEGDLFGAARSFTWASAGYPNHPDVHNGLGNVYTELLQVSQAQEEFGSIAKVPGYEAIAHNNLGNAYRRINLVDEALSEYDQAVQANSNLVAAHFNRGGALLELGRFEESALAFRETAHRATHWAEAYLFEGLAHLRAQNPILASAALYRANEMQLQLPILHLALGVSLQELELDRDAVTHLRQVIIDQPEEAKTYQLLAVSLVRLGEREEAASVLEKGFTLGPQDADAHFTVGLKLFMCDKPDAAAKHFLRAAAKGRRKADTFFALGQALLQTGEIESAVRSLQLASSMDPKAPEIHFSLGIAFFYQGDMKAAIQSLHTAISLDPDDIDSHLVLMDFLRRAGDFEGCAKTGRLVMDASPELIAPRYDTAFCHAMAGNLDLAYETMEDAMDHDIDGQEVSQLWKKLSRMSESKENAPGPYLLLAIIHQRRGNWNEAVKAYEQFILMSPSKRWTQKAMEQIRELVSH